MNNGQKYIKLIGGQNLNVADLINDPQNKILNRIIVDCDTSNGTPINIQLPKVSDLNGATDFDIIVTDRVGKAGITPINITRGGFDIINGGTSVSISTNYGKVYFAIGSLNTGATGASWAAFNTAVGTPYTPPTQTVENGPLDASNDLTLLQTPLTTQHIIVSDASGRVLLTTQFTVTPATKKVNVPALAPGDVIQVYYSY